MSGDLWTPPAVGPDAAVAGSNEDERYQRFDRLQDRMGQVWEAMRLNHDDESVVVIPSDHARPRGGVERHDAPRPTRSGFSSC